MNASTLNRLETIVEKTEIKIEKRDESFFNKSEKWQESDKGLEFEEKTQKLQDFNEELNSAIDTLKEFLED